MINFDQLRQILRKSNIQHVAEKTGLHPNTLYKIARGEHTNITINTLKRITEFFENEENK